MGPLVLLVPQELSDPSARRVFKASPAFRARLGKLDLRVQPALKEFRELSVLRGQQEMSVLLVALVQQVLWAASVLRALKEPQEYKARKEQPGLSGVLQELLVYKARPGCKGRQVRRGHLDPRALALKAQQVSRALPVLSVLSDRREFKALQARLGLLESKGQLVPMVLQDLRARKEQLDPSARQASRVLQVRRVSRDRSVQLGLSVQLVSLVPPVH